MRQASWCVPPWGCSSPSSCPSWGCFSACAAAVTTAAARCTNARGKTQTAGAVCWERSFSPRRSSSRKCHACKHVLLQIIHVHAPTPNACKLRFSLCTLTSDMLLLWQNTQNHPASPSPLFANYGDVLLYSVCGSMVHSCVSWALLTLICRVIRPQSSSENLYHVSVNFVNQGCPEKPQSSILDLYLEDVYVTVMGTFK